MSKNELRSSGERRRRGNYDNRMFAERAFYCIANGAETVRKTQSLKKEANERFLSFPRTDLAPGRGGKRIRESGVEIHGVIWKKKPDRKRNFDAGKNRDEKWPKIMGKPIGTYDTGSRTAW